MVSASATGWPFEPPALARRLAVLTHAITDRRAWRADTIDPGDAWYHSLSPRLLDALDRTMVDWRRRPSPVTALRVDESLCRDCADDLEPVRSDLEAGRGFAIVGGIPRERYGSEEWRAVYWLVGQQLGRPVEQNVQGTLLYDVRDTGQDVRSGVRFSVTNAESSFHGDNSFGDEILDYVGLLCLQGARTGGVSQLLSAYSLHNELLARHPEELRTLYQPFHFDRRGGLRPGDAPTARFPILHWDARGLAVRYLRYWIEVGHDKAGEPLTADQVRALDVMDETMRDPNLRVEFNLKPGETLFVNNRWLLHNRTAFEDYPELERRRHLVRLWLRREVGQAERSKKRGQNP
jgi:hypothetical protein